MLGIFLDCETNGLNPLRHRVLEIAIKCVDLQTGKHFYQYSSIIYHPLNIWAKSNKKSLLINGFTYDEVKMSKKDEKIVADDIVNLFLENNTSRKNAVYICQNPSFDRLFFSQLISIEKQNELFWPYHWFDFASMFFSLTADKKNISSFSKDSIAEYYGIEKEKKPHRAQNGVDHLLLCYETIIGFPYKEKD
jgi:oligoribonuclease